MRNRSVAALVAATLAAAPASALDWEHHFYEAQAPGDLSICTAGVYYSDGPFVMRLYDRVLDFYLADDAFALPPEEELGRVEFLFEDATFTLVADSGVAEPGRAESSHLFLTPREGDYTGLLRRLVEAGTLEIAFPDDTAFTIGLAGSEAALREAFACWTRNETGIAGSNPFTGSARPTNPFE